jgi:hypothetical protein
MDLPAVLRDDGVGLAEKVAAVEAVQTWTPEAVTNNFEMLWDVLSVRCCHVATRVLPALFASSECRCSVLTRIFCGGRVAAATA